MLLVKQIVVDNSNGSFLEDKVNFSQSPVKIKRKKRDEKIDRERKKERKKERERERETHKVRQ